MIIGSGHKMPDTTVDWPLVKSDLGVDWSIKVRYTMIVVWLPLVTSDVIFDFGR